MTRETSEFLKLNEQHVRRLVRKGKLVAAQPNSGKIYYELEDLVAYLQINK